MVSLRLCYNSRVSLTIEQLRHVAELARVRVTDEELHEMFDDIAAVVASFEGLQRLDTGEIEITAHSVESTNVWRDDRLAPGLSREEALACAPESESGLFLVPSILE